MGVARNSCRVCQMPEHASGIGSEAYASNRGLVLHSSTLSWYARASTVQSGSQLQRVGE